MVVSWCLNVLKYFHIPLLRLRENIPQAWESCLKELFEVIKTAKGFSKNARDTVEPGFYGDRMENYLKERVLLSKEDFVKSEKAEKLSVEAIESIPPTLEFPLNPRALGGMCR